jgi:hypothetical protein
MRATIPATRSAADCATTKNRSSWSPATSPWTGRTISPNAVPKQPTGTRPSPATGIRSPPSPAGAGSGDTWKPPQPTASPHSTPSATPSPANPGSHHSPPSPDAHSRHPVNGHLDPVRDLPQRRRSRASRQLSDSASSPILRTPPPPHGSNAGFAHPCCRKSSRAR